MDILFKDNAITYCFLNQVITDYDGNIRLYELVINEEGSLNIDLYTVDLETINNIIQLNKSRTVKYDFKFENNYLQCENVFRNRMTDTMIQKLKNSKESYYPAVKSIYHMFLDIITAKGKYIESKAIAGLTEGYMGTDIVDFRNIAFSESSMSCFIRVKVEDVWTTRKFIYMDDGRLKTNDFYFCVPSTNKYMLDDYSLEHAGEYMIYNEPHTVFKYTGDVPIYTYTPQTLRIFAPLIVRYTFNSAYYKATVTVGEHLVNQILKSTLQGPPTAVEKANYGAKGKEVRYGMYFKSSIKRPTLAELDEIAAITLDRYIGKLRSKEMTVEDVVRDLYIKKTDILRIYIHISVIEMFIESNLPPLDRVDKINAVIGRYKERKLFSDLYLYSLRASLYISQFAHIRPISESILLGSDVPYYVFLERRLKDEFLPDVTE